MTTKNRIASIHGLCAVFAPVYYFIDNALFDIQNWDWFEFY